MNTPSLTFSVIIPVYNGHATIVQTLHAVQSQSLHPLEIIVVDDGSTDDTARLIALFPGVRYVFQENQGPAAARNKGASMARGSVLVFTDADCRPRGDWIELIAAGFVREEIAAVAGSYGIMNPERLLARCVHREILYRHQYLMPEYPSVFGSYNVAIRAEVFFCLGGFQECYRHASGEDNDLSYRLRQDGGLIFFARNALVDHQHPWVLTRYWREQFRHGFWRVRMYRDHPLMARGDGYTFWKDIVEVPLSLLIVAGLFFVVLSPLSLISTVWWILIGMLISLEIWFAMVMGGSFKERCFMSLVMLGRSFARAVGFFAGFLVRGSNETTNGKSLKIM
jgi:glycosyltransferase involved in cell wall biosynthesis